METWYLLFGGSSADGRGTGRYPYSTGDVEIITDAGCHAAMRESDFPQPNTDIERKESLK